MKSRAMIHDGYRSLERALAAAVFQLAYYEIRRRRCYEACMDYGRSGPDVTGSKRSF